MTNAERIDFNRRLCDGLIDAYANCVERQRVEMPPEYVLSDDAVVWAPTSFGDLEQSGRKLVDDRTPTERNTAEFRAFWKHMPDFRLVAHGQPSVTAEGFAVWFRFEGTTKDGRRLGFYEADYIQTNERGEIYRVETFHDKEGLLPILELLGMAPKDLSLDSLLELRKEASAGG